MTRNGPGSTHDQAIAELVVGLRNAGITTSNDGGLTNGWGSYFYFPSWEEGPEPDTVYVIHAPDAEHVAERLKNILQNLLPATPSRILSIDEAFAQSREMKRDYYVAPGLHATIAYAMRDRPD